MFSNLGWPEILVIVAAGLFILGPERIPDTIRRGGQLLRRTRSYATGARDQLRDDLGPELDEFREPLEQLRSLRAAGARQTIVDHVLDGYDPTDDAEQLDPRRQMRAPEQPADTAGTETTSPRSTRTAAFDPDAT